MIASLGAMLVGIASLLLYLSAPHQKLASPLRKAPLIAGLGLIALVGGTALLLAWAGPATAIFIAMTIVMAIWSVLPIVVAWRRGAPEGKA